MIYYGTNQTPTLSLKSYPFGLSITPENESSSLIIQRFRFKYDFSKKVGKINFETREQEIKDLTFYFPSNISIREVNLYVREKLGHNYSNLNINYTDNCSKTKKNTYCIEGNLLRVDDGLNGLYVGNNNYQFEVNYILKLEPNAIFTLDTHNQLVNQDIFAFELYLGDDYECIGPCYIDLINTYEYYKSSPQNLTIGFEEEKKSEAFYRFKIISKHKKAEFNKSFWPPIGVTVLFFGLTLLLQYFISKKESKYLKKIKEDIFNKIDRIIKKKNPKKIK